MSKLRLPKPEEAISFFELYGWKRSSQKGSHVKMKKAGALRPLVIPVGKRELTQYVLYSNLRTAGIAIDEFRRFAERNTK